MTASPAEPSTSSSPSASRPSHSPSHHCDSCGSDLSSSVRIHCAEKDSSGRNVCGNDFDLCVNCFLEGKEVGKHKAWHSYCVVVSQIVSYLGVLTKRHSSL
jgi:transcriptional adapter 2-alpha